MKKFCSLKTFWICIGIWFSLMCVSEAFAASPCEDAIRRYGEKLPDFTCSERDSNDAVQTRLQQMFRQLAEKRKREGYVKPKPEPVAPIVKQVETKPTQKEGYQLQFKKDFEVNW